MQGQVRFEDVLAKNYKDQAIFFLNAFWPEVSGDAELVWRNHEKFIELDTAHKKDGTQLDEFNSHRVFEFFNETKTVVKLRELRAGLGIDRKKQMSLVEYLLCKYNQTVRELLVRPQGSSEELVKAQRALDAVRTEIDRIEKRKAELESASQGSGVRAMQAKNELSQLLSGDNTELNRALLTAEAAVRKAQRSGAGGGSLFFIERELTEMKKYKPQSKGGISRT